MREHTHPGPWKHDPKEDYYFTNNDLEAVNYYYILTRHPILVTRKTKATSDEERETLIKEVAQAMKDRYPEVGDALFRRGEHLAEVAVETIEKHNSDRPKEAT